MTAGNHFFNDQIISFKTKIVEPICIKCSHKSVKIFKIITVDFFLFFFLLLFYHFNIYLHVYTLFVPPLPSFLPPQGQIS
jgi:hypothetical protein